MNVVVEAIQHWRRDPIKFVRDNFQTEPDMWQRRALIAFADGNNKVLRLSLQACVGPGKSAVLAWMGWYFLSCFGTPQEHPKGIAISITRENLASNLWPEFSKWQQRSPYLSAKFCWTKSRIYCVDHPETWFIDARGYAQTANEEELGKTLSGLHSQFVLVLVDESGNVPVAILKAAEQALGNCTFGRIVQAGNPTSHDGMLYAAATRFRDQWYVIRITGDPLDPERSPRISIVWAQTQIDLYGRDDPWIKSSILGEFPEASINALLSVNDVENAMRRDVRPEVYDWVQKRLGIDVARFGTDRTILFPRQGLKAFKPVVMRGARTNEIGARALMAKNKWGYELEFIDDTGGFGSGVIDWLLTAGSNPQAVNSSSKATNPRFYNKRAEMYYAGSEWIKRGGCLPNVPELVKELTAATYTFKDGKLLLEPKDKIKEKLGGHSPDYADALMLTFSVEDVPGIINIPGYNPNKVQNYDPYDHSDDYRGAASYDNYDPLKD